MKKLLLIASSVLLTLSCGTSDDSSSNNSNNNSSSKITPPTWIQGTYYQVFEGSERKQFGYKFYSNDLCVLQYTHENCMQGSIDIYQGTNAYTNVEQSITDTEYKCTITIQSQKLNYHFQKVSDNTIKDVNMSNSSGTTVLLKKE